VKEKYRNQGIGSKLMKESKLWAQKHGMDYLRLAG